MPDWTESELAAEGERLADIEATGVCPYSGYSIDWCWSSDLCDCAYAPPLRCTACQAGVWDLVRHQRLHEAVS